MTIEERLRYAQRLAEQLATPFTLRGRKRIIDDNEVRKVFGFLKVHRDIGSLYVLLEKLPDSPFAERSDVTREYFRRIKGIILRLLPSKADVDDILWILGWAWRLMKYELSKRGEDGTPSSGLRPRSGRAGPSDRF